MRRLLWMSGLLSISLWGADVTGKWSGTYEMAREGETRSAPAIAILKQDGTTVTGTIGPSETEQFKIKTGAIEGNRIHLEIEPAEGPHLVVLELILDGDRLTGEATGETEDGKFAAKLSLSRQKSD
ncbi:MAG TPA: hypothetical protein VFA28_18110 [Bryobacteraceae bacterium]|jgi:hypothetical protein|nr:hypothetical protein [Bryobacteraceae bacterium]